MPIKLTSVNGVDRDAKLIELEDALAVYAKDPSPENERNLVLLYEQTSGFKSGCGVCLAGRNIFMRGLSQLKDGDNEEALASFRTSFRSVTFKWGRLVNKLRMK